MRLRKLSTVIALSALAATSLTAISMQTASAATDPSCPPAKPTSNGVVATETQVSWAYNAGKSYTTSQKFCIYHEGFNRRLVWQSDGNLVLYGAAHTGGNAIWSSNTYGKSAARLVLQADGNAVIYNTKGAPIWHSNTWRSDSQKKKAQYGISFFGADGGVGARQVALWGGGISASGTPETFWNERPGGWGWYKRL